MPYHKFFIESLYTDNWDDIKKCFEFSKKTEIDLHNTLSGCFAGLIEDNGFFDSFFRAKNYSSRDIVDLKETIIQDINYYCKNGELCRKGVFTGHRNKENIYNKFVLGTKQVNSDKMYYAILVALALFYSETNIINHEKYYYDLFSTYELGGPSRQYLRPTNIEENNVYDKEFWKKKGYILILLAYFAIIFESTLNIKDSLRKTILENIRTSIDAEFPSKMNNSKCMADRLHDYDILKHEYNGKLVKRSTIENLLGPVKDSFFCEKNRIIEEVTYIMYTGSSFLNVMYAEKGMASSKSLIKTEPIIKDFINDGGDINIIVMNPFCSSADEAVCYDKLGNVNNQGMKTSFSLAYETLIETLSRNNDLNVKYTNIALPYSISKVRFVDEYRKYDYIKIDLYSSGLKSNRERVSSIIFEDSGDHSYSLFDKEITYISDKSYDIDLSYQPEIRIIKKSTYEGNNKKDDETVRRVYFSGQNKFDLTRNFNIPNAYSDIEFGTSLYSTEVCDKAHYHRTTNEHYMIIQGEQHIYDINNKKEYIAKEGDVVLIPKLTPHITKEIPNTKIVFAKSPLESDKIVLEESADVQTWKNKKEPAK